MSASTVTKYSPAGRRRKGVVGQRRAHRGAGGVQVDRRPELLDDQRAAFVGVE
jgi:hypothetical protein